MKVSILIANFNNGHFFKECWNSIVDQTYSNWEVIIVDDCSTDNSVKVIEDTVNGNNKVHVYKNTENKGCGYTKRRCAEYATGEYAFFLDPDDLIVPTAIELLVQEFQAKKDAVLVYSNFKRFDQEGTSFSAKELKQVENGLVQFFNIDGMVSHIAMFKTEAYFKTEGIDPYLLRAVDQDLYLKLYEVGSFYCLDKVLHHYRIHNNGISTGGENNLNRLKAKYWQWHVITSAAKRRGVYVEDLYIQSQMLELKNKDSKIKSLQQELNLIDNSKSYKLAQRISRVFQKIKFSK